MPTEQHAEEVSHATIVQTTVLSEDCNNLITATMPQAWGNMNVGISLAFACGHPCIVRNAANAETANIYALLPRPKAAL